MGLPLNYNSGLPRESPASSRSHEGIRGYNSLRRILQAISFMLE